MMAYNQGKYIGDAIDSVLQQSLPFEWELLIGDDHSIDNTAEVVRRYAAKEIKYILREKNVGLHANYVDLVRRARGEYIALLEADDYWLDKDKTAKQVALMDEDPTIVWSFTNGIIVNQNKQLIKEVNNDLPSTFNLKYYLSNFFNPINNSIIFRRSVEPNTYPDMFFTITQWDSVLHMLRAKKGLIGFVPINGVAWRRHPEATSMTSNFSGSKRYTDWLIIQDTMPKELGQEYKPYFQNKGIAYEYLSIYFLKKKKVHIALQYVLRMVFSKPRLNSNRLKDYLWKIRNAFDYA